MKNYFADALAMDPRDLPDDLISESFAEWFNERFGAEVLRIERLEKDGAYFMSMGIDTAMIEAMIEERRQL